MTASRFRVKQFLVILILKIKIYSFDFIITYFRLTNTYLAVLQKG
jgi:hypothetical protein